MSAGGDLERGVIVDVVTVIITCLMYCALSRAGWGRLQAGATMADRTPAGECHNNWHETDSTGLIYQDVTEEE
eukprot:3868250-Rhodomonas_salina.1